MAMIMSSYDKKGEKELEKLSQLKNKISESLRAEKKNFKDIPYVDFHNNLNTALSLSNQVVFGRRGSGKTMLMRNLEDACFKKNIRPIFIDCEIIKRYPYPDILIFILKTLFEELEKDLGFRFFKAISKKGRLK
ncbi:ATP-binding protein, partial [Candidatus Woesearchaeota archaeon]|nr:ATP-binding protein [Candidatus Woesearchaeota archaeon]